MENQKHKETIVINFDDIEVSNWKSGHLDADIYEDGTSSLPGIGKNPKEIDTQKMNWASDEGDGMKDYSKDDDGLIMVALHKETYPEVTMWAVVPKQEWEKTVRTTEEILELIEKTVSGTTFKEDIKKLEQENRLMERDSVQEQLERLVKALKEAELIVEPAEDEKQMSVEELSQKENILLYGNIDRAD